MSIHIGADKGDIAKTVLISGDPLRAKHTAEKMLSDVSCYNQVRGMYGYTGSFRGKRVSIQGTGMGIPTTAIYLNELFMFYDVECVIRVGTCGALQSDIELGEIILAMSASSDSNMNRLYFDQLDFAPTADFNLLLDAFEHSKKLDTVTHVGPIFSSDNFYDDTDNRWNKWINHGILGVEMETSILYTLAARFNAKALSLLTVSDNIITGESSSSKDREQSYMSMMELGFQIAVV